MPNKKQLTAFDAFKQFVADNLRKSRDEVLKMRNEDGFIMLPVKGAEAAALHAELYIDDENKYGTVVVGWLSPEHCGYRDGRAPAMFEFCGDEPIDTMSAGEDKWFWLQHYLSTYNSLDDFLSCWFGKWYQKATFLYELEKCNQQQAN